MGGIDRHALPAHVENNKEREWAARRCLFRLDGGTGRTSCFIYFYTPNCCLFLVALFPTKGTWDIGKEFQDARLAAQCPDDPL